MGSNSSGHLKCIQITSLVFLTIVNGQNKRSDVNHNDERCTINLPKFSAALRRSATGDGFHRTLICNFTVEFDDLSDEQSSPSTLTSRNFRFLIKEHFPSSMYVDPYDQIADDENGFQLHFPDPVDVENAADDGPTSSMKQTVYIFQNDCSREHGDVQNRQRFKCSYQIPFHLRYQKATSAITNNINKSNGNFVEVLLPIPEMFIDYNIQQDIRFTDYCDHYFWTDFSNPTGTIKNRWLKMHLNSKSSYKTSLKFRVPYGDPKNLPLAIGVTILTVVTSCGYLIYAIVCSRNLN